MKKLNKKTFDMNKYKKHDMIRNEMNTNMTFNDKLQLNTK